MIINLKHYLQYTFQWYTVCKTCAVTWGRCGTQLREQMLLVLCFRMSIQSSQLILFMFLIIEDWWEWLRTSLKKKPFEQNQVIEYCFDEY